MATFVSLPTSRLKNATDAKVLSYRISREVLDTVVLAQPGPQDYELAIFRKDESRPTVLKYDNLKDASAALEALAGDCEIL